MISPILQVTNLVISLSVKFAFISENVVILIGNTYAVFRCEHQIFSAVLPTNIFDISQFSQHCRADSMKFSWYENIKVIYVRSINSVYYIITDIKCTLLKHSKD